jgi:hypothetical protein
MGLLRFLSHQSSLYRQYSSPSMAPVTTFEIASDQLPKATAEPVGKKINELFDQQTKEQK